MEDGSKLFFLFGAQQFGRWINGTELEKAGSLPSHTHGKSGRKAAGFDQLLMEAQTGLQERSQAMETDKSQESNSPQRGLQERSQAMEMDKSQKSKSPQQNCRKVAGNGNG